VLTERFSLPDWALYMKNSLFNATSTRCSVGNSHRSDLYRSHLLSDLVIRSSILAAHRMNVVRQIQRLFVIAARRGARQPIAARLVASRNWLTFRGNTLAMSGLVIVLASSSSLCLLP